jgi:hypothetical protein
MNSGLKGFVFISLTFYFEFCARYNFLSVITVL